MESQKQFTLIIVRHGEGYHNLHTLSRDELVFTNDEHLKTLAHLWKEYGGCDILHHVGQLSK